MHHAARGCVQASDWLSGQLGPSDWLSVMQGNCIPAKRATKEDTGQAAQAQSQIDFLKVNL